MLCLALQNIFVMAKPAFTFFKLLNCSACQHFEAKFFQRLIEDNEVRNAVYLDRVVFGREPDGTVLTLEEQYSDLEPKIQYAPYLWLSQPYDESTGYHLDPATRNDPALNTRLNGKEFSFRQDTTYEDVKHWILAEAGRYRGFRKATTKNQRR
jgi:hypothetical protein